MELTLQASNYEPSKKWHVAGKTFMFFTGEVIYHYLQGQYFMALLCMVEE